MIILNLTQHNTSTAQYDMGVREPSEKSRIRALLTFVEIPAIEEMRERAEELADIAEDSGCGAVMLGGAPFFMGTLEQELKRRGIRVFYAFSLRESQEHVNPDGTVSKTAIFRHVGFVEV